MHRSKILGWFLLIAGLFGWNQLSGQTVFVWPGDANDNGKANHVDLLYLGLHYGRQGTARDSISINWVPHEVAKWLPPMGGRADPAHADCNGDSTVNSLDMVAIETNYGLDNGFIVPDSSSISGLLTDPALSFSFPLDSLAAGSTDTIPLFLGTSSLPVDSLLGFAATIEYDSNLVDTAYAWFGDSWLGTPGQNLLSMDHYEKGSLSLSATRIDRLNAQQGKGAIGGIVIVMDDNLKTHASLASLRLEFSQVLCIDNQGLVVDVRPEVDSVEVYRPSEEFGALVYPVPAWDQLQIRMLNPAQGRVEGRLMDAQGRLVRNFSFENAAYVMPCEQLLAGIYYLQLSAGSAILTKKIIVLREGF